MTTTPQNHHGLNGRLSAMVGQLTESAPAEDKAWEEMSYDEQKAAKIAQTARSLEEFAPAIAAALPAQFNAERMASLVLNQVRKAPELSLCTQESLYGAILTCSQLGLEPGDATGEAYLIPRRNKGVYEATFQLGYKGMVTLFWRHPLAAYLHTDTVKEGDDFDYGYGLDPFLVHKPQRKRKDQATARGERLGYWYAAARLTNGAFAFTVLDTADVERRRAKSSSPNSPAWKGEYDAMAEKSCIRKLFNLMPKTRETQQALAWEGQVRRDLDAAALDDAPRPDYDQQDDDAEGDVVLPGGAGAHDV